MSETLVSPDALNADDIPWGRGGLANTVPWPDHDAVINEAIALLPSVVDDDAAAIIEHLLVALISRGEELRAVRLVSSTMGTALHETDRELSRTRERYHATLDQRRAERLSSDGGA